MQLTPAALATVTTLGPVTIKSEPSAATLLHIIFLRKTSSKVRGAHFTFVILSNGVGICGNTVKLILLPAAIGLSQLSRIVFPSDPVCIITS